MARQFTVDEVFKYVAMWRDDDNYTDLNLFLDKGYLDLAIRTLIEAGGIDSRMCFDYAVEIEAFIEKRNKSYGKRQYQKDLSEALHGVECWVHRQSNEHWFIDKDMHYVTDEELRSWNYLPDYEHDFYKRG